MASEVKLARRQANAIVSIKNSMSQIADIFGMEAPDIEPTKRWGMDNYRTIQLETIASFLQHIAENENLFSNDDEVSGDGTGNALPDFDAMTVSQLESKAKALGIYDDIEGTGSGGNIKKDDLVGALVNAEKVAKPEDPNGDA
jgi:hypothetical protein